MEHHIEQLLRQKAQWQFGEKRSVEIESDIAKAAADVEAIRAYPFSIHDEL